MIIRKMKISDINEVSKIENESFKDPWPSAAFLEALFHKNIISVVAVEDKNSVIGYGIAVKENKFFHIANLAVKKTHRKKGIGSEILSYLLSLNERKPVILEVRKSNRKAIKLYKKFKFKKYGEIKNYYPDSESAIVMIKK